MIGKQRLVRINRITQLEIEMQDRAIRKFHRYNGKAEFNDGTSAEFVVDSACPIFLDEQGIFFVEPTPKGNGHLQIYSVRAGSKIYRENARALEDSIKHYLTENYENFVESSGM